MTAMPLASTNSARIAMTVEPMLSAMLNQTVPRTRPPTQPTPPTREKSPMRLDHSSFANDSNMRTVPTGATAAAIAPWTKFPT